jgi:mRNA interferase RelE/StbE
MHEILLSARAERDLKRLPAELFHRIIVEIRSLSTTPRPLGSRKLTGSDRDYRIRVGDYCAIYEVDDRAKTLKIMRIRHRREAYR